MRHYIGTLKLLSVASVFICIGFLVEAQIPPVGCTISAHCSDTQCTGTDCSLIELKCKFNGSQASQNYISKSCCTSPPAHPRHPWYCCETKNYWHICNNGDGLICNETQTFVRLNCTRNALLPYCPLSGSGCSGQPNPED